MAVGLSAGWPLGLESTGCGSRLMSVALCCVALVNLLEAKAGSLLQLTEHSATHCPTGALCQNNKQDGIVQQVVTECRGLDETDSTSVAGTTTGRVPLTRGTIEVLVCRSRVVCLTRHCILWVA